MSLNYLLLGITRDGATGYEIKRAFDEGLRHIWDAELSQIYTTLQRMEGSGLLKSTRLPGERGTGRRVYKLTAAGRRELKQWLRSDPVLHDERHPFLVQLCLLGELGDEAETLKYFQALRAAMRARLQAILSALRSVDCGGRSHTWEGLYPPRRRPCHTGRACNRGSGVNHRIRCHRFLRSGKRKCPYLVDGERPPS